LVLINVKPSFFQIDVEEFMKKEQEKLKQEKQMIMNDQNLIGNLSLIALNYFIVMAK
jgi:hypothetical protein